jgi:hypothetical protein
MYLKRKEGEAMPFSKLIATNREINWNNKDITFLSRSIKWASRGGGDQRFASPGIYHAYSNGTLRSIPTITISGTADELTLSMNGKSLTINSLSNETITKEGWLTILPGENDISVDGISFDVTLSVVFRDRFI